MVICDVCKINVSNLKEHENTKKHRNALFDMRRNNAKAKNTIGTKQATELFKKVFSHSSCIELVMKYIPTSSLLSMRLVCKEWKEYLDNSNHWNIQEGYHFDCVNTLFILRKLSNHIYLYDKNSVDRFITNRDYNDEDLFIKIRFGDIHLSPKLCKVFETMNFMNVEIYFFSNFSGKHLQLEYSSFCETIFSCISKNTNIIRVKTSITSLPCLQGTPLEWLAPSTSISTLIISPNWFACTGKVNANLIVDNSYVYLFNNHSVRSLSISNIKQGSLNPVNAKFILHAIAYGTHCIESLNMSSLGLSASTKQKIPQYINKILRTGNIRDLDFSNNIALRQIELNQLNFNNSIESLNLSNTPEAWLRKDLSKNKSLLNLNLSRSNIRIRGSVISKPLVNLPSSLHHLNLDGHAARIFSGVLDSIPTSLPSLISLDIRHMSIPSLNELAVLIKNSSIQTLLLFEGAVIVQSDCVEFQEAIDNNNTLTKCDHKVGLKSNIISPSLFNSFEECIKRNSIMKGRRTKGCK